MGLPSATFADETETPRRQEKIMIEPQRRRGVFLFASVLLPVPQRTQLGEQHIVRRWVLGVVLENRPLEILHIPGFVVEVGQVDPEVGNREALLRQRAMSVPVVEEDAGHALAGLRESAAATARYARRVVARRWCRGGFR